MYKDCFIAGAKGFNNSQGIVQSYFRQYNDECLEVDSEGKLITNSSITNIIPGTGPTNLGKAEINFCQW